MSSSTNLKWRYFQIGNVNVSHSATRNRFEVNQVFGSFRRAPIVKSTTIAQQTSFDWAKAETAVSQGECGKKKKGLKNGPNSNKFVFLLFCPFGCVVCPWMLFTSCCWLYFICHVYLFLSVLFMRALNITILAWFIGRMNI